MRASQAPVQARRHPSTPVAPPVAWPKARNGPLASPDPATCAALAADLLATFDNGGGVLPDCVLGPEPADWLAALELFRTHGSRAPLAAQSARMRNQVQIQQRPNFSYPDRMIRLKPDEL
jgi:hypothetical protein